MQILSNSLCFQFDTCTLCHVDSFVSICTYFLHPHTRQRQLKFNPQQLYVTIEHVAVVILANCHFVNEVT